MDFIYSFTVALFLTIALIPLLIRFAPSLGLMDLPEARKVHVRAIPRSGGLAIALGVAAPLLVLMPLQDPWRGVLLGAAVIIIFGVLDDRRNLNYRWKFLGQIIAVALAMHGGVVIDRCPFLGLDAAPSWLAYPLTFFFMVGVTNAVNLSDGLDGLAAGTTLLALVMLVLLALTSGQWSAMLVCLTIIGGVLGFLRYNTHPAQIFMGDTGSQFLGFMAAALALLIVQHPQMAVSPVLPLLILGLPILDTLMVMAIRIAQRRSPFSPDRNHLHHQLIDLGFYHYEAVATIYLLQVLIIGLGFFLRYEADVILLSVYVIFAAGVVGTLWLARRGGWRLHQEMTSGRERRNPLLRRLSWFYRNSPALVQILTGAFFLIAALILQPLHGDNLLLTWMLAPLLILALLAMRRWPIWMTRICCYSTAILLSYLLSRDASVIGWLPWLHGHLLVLAAMLVLAIRMTRREQFSLDTQDLLVLLLILCVPVLPLDSVGQFAVGEVALRLAVLMYSCEFLIGRAGGRGLILLSSLAMGSILLLAVLH